MRRAMWVAAAALVLVVAGCTSGPEPALKDRLAYSDVRRVQPTPVSEKSIVVVPFEDLRETCRTHDISMLLNLIPLTTWYTTGVNSHLDAEAGSGGRDSFAVAMAELLARHLTAANAARRVDFLTEGELKQAEGYDLVLRGKLRDATLETTRYSYCLGPGAIVPYLLGAPIVHYQPSLTVEWRLYDGEGNATTNVETAAVPGCKPVGKNTGLYYGHYANGVDTPLGLYTGAVRCVNRQITEDLLTLLAE
ncbi:MAG: hypothetical protein ACOC70_02070 [bacterium]